MKGTKRILSMVFLLVLVCALVPAPEISAAKNGYLTLEEAGAVLRDCMASRRTQQTIKVHLETDMPLTNGQIFGCLLKEASKHTGNGKEGDALRWAWNQTGYLIEDEFDGKDHYITFELYTATYYSTAQQEQELDTKVAQIIQSLNLSGKSDYEKVCAIYDYVCFNVKYAEEVYEGGDIPSTDPKYYEFYSAYSALVNGKATCQGFSIAMYRLLLEAGVDNRIVTGTAGGYGHGWNIVKLGDLYYCLDSTWDSDWYPAFGFPVYFLKGASAFGDHKTYLENASTEFRDNYPIAGLDYGAEATATASGKCGDNANWALAADGTLTISGSGDIWHLYEITEGWMDLRGYVKKLVIKEGITSIGIETFYGLQELREVSIPSTVTTIYDNAFQMCTKLTEITIPDSVETIGNGAFGRCWSLKNVRLPKGLTTISEQLFAACIELESITIPSSVTAISANAFNDCCGLGEITIPNSVHTLGFGAFAGAFDPEKKVSLTIPESVTEIDQACFEVSGLKEVIWNAKTDSVNQAMFNLCRYLENVVFNDHISKLEDKVLYECVSLKTVKLPSALQEMGWEVLASCKSLKTVELPTTLTKLPHSTFWACDALEMLQIPDSITVIEHHNFEGCKSLKNLTIPASVKILEDYLFAESGLEELRFEGNMPDIATFAFAAMTRGECVVYYPSGDTTWKIEVTDEIASNNLNVSFVAHHGAEGPHTLGGEWLCSSEGHWQKCLGCDHIGVAEAHAYDGVCDGECNICGYARAVTHVYDRKQYNENVHWVECACGESGEKVAHKFTNRCDDTCDDCGYCRVAPHDYQWKWNDEQHWKLCVCGAGEGNPVAHSWSGGKCSVCGGEQHTDPVDPGPSDTHIHTMGSEWRSNSQSHWHQCTGCSYREDEAAHTFTDNCDATCNDCGYFRVVSHDYQWQWNDEQHWKICSCGAGEGSPENHSWSDGKCSLCGADKPAEPSQPSNPTDPSEPSAEPSQPSAEPTQPQDPEPSEPDSFGYIWVIVAGAVLVAGGGVAVLVVKKRKAHK